MLLCRQELRNGRDKHHSKCSKIRRYQCTKRLFQGRSIPHGQQRIYPGNGNQGRLHTGIPLYYQQAHHFHLAERRPRKTHWFTFCIPSLFQCDWASIWAKGHKLYSASCGSGSTNASNYDVNHRKGIAIWEI